MEDNKINIEKEHLYKLLREFKDGKIGINKAKNEILLIFSASGSVCCNAELINFNTYGYDECSECGKTYTQQNSH
jgi:hypothetical protein